MTHDTLVCLLPGHGDHVRPVRAALAVHDADVLVLEDDATGWSPATARLCREAGAVHHRAPGPLGGTRAANVALTVAQREGYGQVLLAEPGTVLSRDAARAAARARSADVACVGLWSDDAGEYSLDLGAHAARWVAEDAVDWLASEVAAAVPGTGFDVPLLGGACTAFTTEAVAEIGLLDTALPGVAVATADWSLRARAASLRSRLSTEALAVRGGAHRPSAGAETLGRFVPEAAAAWPWRVLRQRFPALPDQLDAFRASGRARAAADAATRHVVVAGARLHGWTVEVGDRAASDADDWSVARCVVDVTDPATWTVTFRGQRLAVRHPDDGEDLAVHLTELFDRRPENVRALDGVPGARAVADRVAASAAGAGYGAPWDTL